MKRYLIPIGFSCLLMLLTLFVYGDTPFTIQKIEDSLDVTAINNNFRNIERELSKHLNVKNISVSNQLDVKNISVSNQLDVKNISVSSNIYMVSEKKIIFDSESDSDTYLHTPSEDRIDFYANAVRVLSVLDISWQGFAVLYQDGDILPATTNTHSLGSASLYWDEIHYKTLTAHSLKIAADKDEPATKKIDNIKIEDKFTYPSDVYVPPKYNEKGEEIGEAGTNMNQLIVYLIDAIKELNQRITTLEETGKEGK